jgi:hypothetical protein
MSWMHELQYPLKRRRCDALQSSNKMRLLNTTTLKLTKFFDNNIPEYAILSHTWEKGEVSFQDWESGRGTEKEGYLKIMGACKQALLDKLEYVWIDTCCIDKSSSAELSEAINSMYRWYKGSTICYTYLVDVPDGTEPSTANEFARSRIHGRGWTLQELIASEYVVFYSRGWQKLGTKFTLLKELETITGIHAGVLSGNSVLSHRSIAERMSWAAHRKTTRTEDMAYCLMGVFEVNMPLLYGEGEKAFIRLQEEIMRTIDDDSIFAWIDNRNEFRQGVGVLAPSPAYFAQSGDIFPINSRYSNGHTLTSQGVRMEVPLIPTETSLYLVPLRCGRRGSRGPLGILVAPLVYRYIRMCAHKHVSSLEHSRQSEETIVPARTVHFVATGRLLNTLGRGAQAVGVLYRFKIDFPPRVFNLAKMLPSGSYSEHRTGSITVELRDQMFGPAAVMDFLISPDVGVVHATHSLLRVIVGVNCNFGVTVRLHVLRSLEAGEPLEALGKAWELAARDAQNQGESA